MTLGATMGATMVSEITGRLWPGFCWISWIVLLSTTNLMKQRTTSEDVVRCLHMGPGKLAGARPRISPLNSALSIAIQAIAPQPPKSNTPRTQKKTAQHREAMSGQDRRVTTTTCAYMGLRMRKSIRCRPEPPYTKTPKNQTTPISPAPNPSSIPRTRRRPLTARFACQP